MLAVLFYTAIRDYCQLSLAQAATSASTRTQAPLPKFFWDASTERLGIGNAAPTSALDVTGTVTATEFNIAEFSTSTNVLQSNTGGTGARLRASVSSAAFPTFALAMTTTRAFSGPQQIRLVLALAAQNASASTHRATWALGILTLLMVI
jgi:hypothetical protein